MTFYICLKSGSVSVLTSYKRKNINNTNVYSDAAYRFNYQFSKKDTSSRVEVIYEIII